MTDSRSGQFTTGWPWSQDLLDRATGPRQSPRRWASTSRRRGSLEYRPARSDRIQPESSKLAAATLTHPWIGPSSRQSPRHGWLRQPPAPPRCSRRLARERSRRWLGIGGALDARAPIAVVVQRFQTTGHSDGVARGTEFLPTPPAGLPRPRSARMHATYAFPVGGIAKFRSAARGPERVASTLALGRGVWILCR